MMRKPHSVFVICVMVLGITVQAKAQQKQASDEKKSAGFWQKAAQKLNGTIHVEGEVHDGKGSLLKNVQVQGSKRKETGFWQAKRVDISKSISGHFSFTFKDCSTVALDFIKEGYRRAHVSAPGKSGPGDTDFPFKMEDIKVVLYKRGKITLLRNYGGTLQYKADGSGTVIVIEPNKDPRKHKPTRKLTNVKDAKALPNRSVFMIPSTTEEGKIDTVQIGELNEHTRDGIYPKKLRLIMKAEKGGFIEFKPKKDVPLAIQMTEAPKEGYKKEILLSAERLNRMRRNRHGVKGKTWFYFRVGDLYGKGYCGRLSSRDRSEHLKLEVGLYLQLNGSRNVETKRPAPY